MLAFSHDLGVELSHRHITCVEPVVGSSCFILHRSHLLLAVFARVQFLLSLRDQHLVIDSRFAFHFFVLQAHQVCASWAQVHLRQRSVLLVLVRIRRLLLYGHALVGEAARLHLRLVAGVLEVLGLHTDARHVGDSGFVLEDLAQVEADVVELFEPGFLEQSLDS